MSQPTTNQYQPNTPQKPTVQAKHTLATRILHHGSAVFILALWILVEFEDNLEDILSMHPVAVHKALGAIFLIWVVVRIINLVIRPRMPKLPAPTWQTAMAHLVHFGLYFCMLAMPISGVLMSVYGGRAVSVFGIFEIPVFVAPDRMMSKLFNEIHTDVIFPVLMFCIVAHIAAAIYHQVILKDNLIGRMK